MMPTSDRSDRVKLLTANDAAYRRALEAFLAGTDEKEVTHAYLTRMVQRLPQRRACLDVGAADGTTTRHLSRFFEQTLCIEPSDHMQEPLRRNCPGALVLREPVLEARVPVRVDLALLSHVLYYLPRRQWAPVLSRVLGWLRPGGRLVVALQNPGNACMRMVRHFTGARFDLAGLAEEMTRTAPSLAEEIRIDTLPVRYRSTSLDEAVAVAEFHLSVPEPSAGKALPTRREVGDYVRRHFTDPAGGFTMPHDQDVLHIRKPAACG